MTTVLCDYPDCERKAYSRQRDFHKCYAHYVLEELLKINQRTRRQMVRAHEREMARQPKGQ